MALGSELDVATQNDSVTETRDNLTEAFVCCLPMAIGLNQPRWAAISQNEPMGQSTRVFSECPCRDRQIQPSPWASRVAKSSRTRRSFACWPNSEQTSLRARARLERRNNIRIAACCSVKSPSIFPQAAAGLGYADLVLRVQSAKLLPSHIESPSFPTLKLRTGHARRGTNWESLEQSGRVHFRFAASIGFATIRMRKCNYGDPRQLSVAVQGSNGLIPVPLKSRTLRVTSIAPRE